MKPSIELFKLIKSLSKSEKRFFKLSSTLQSGEKNYLRLFDYIEALDTYDEEGLKQHFKGEAFIKHLPSEKKSFVQTHLKKFAIVLFEQSINSILKQEIKNIEILYNKALYRECVKFLERAKSQAKQYEKFYYWFELISWEKKLLESAFESGEFGADLDELVAEEELVISRLRNLAEYHIIYSKINLVFRSGGFSRNEEERKVVDAIADYHLIKGRTLLYRPRQHPFAITSKVYVQQLTGIMRIVISFNRTKEILDSNPYIKIDASQRYVMTLIHLLRCYIDSGDMPEAKKILIEIRELPADKGFNSMDIDLRIFGHTYYLELVMLHKMGAFQESVDMISVIEQKRQNYGDKISKEIDLLLTYNKAYSYFGIGDYKRALSHLNDVLNDSEQNLRKDVYSFARLFNLVIHFELGNYDFLEYIVKSTSRFYSKQDKDFEVETTCIRAIRKLAKLPGELQRMESYEKLNQEIQDLLQDHHERVILEYFDIRSWVRSKIERIPFAEAVRKGVLMP